MGYSRSYLFVSLYSITFFYFGMHGSIPDLIVFWVASFVPFCAAEFVSFLIRDVCKDKRMGDERMGDEW